MIVDVLPDRRPAPLTWATPVLLPAPAAATAPPPQRGEGVDAPMGALVRALAEVCAGQRSAAQLSRWVSEDVLALLGAHHGTWRPPWSFVGLRAQHRDDVAEVAVHVRADGTHHAVALRLVRRSRRWLCTAAEWAPPPG